MRSSTQSCLTTWPLHGQMRPTRTCYRCVRHSLTRALGWVVAAFLALDRLVFGNRWLFFGIFTIECVSMIFFQSLLSPYNVVTTYAITLFTDPQRRGAERNCRILVVSFAAAASFTTARSFNSDTCSLCVIAHLIERRGSKCYSSMHQSTMNEVFVCFQRRRQR